MWFGRIRSSCRNRFETEADEIVLHPTKIREFLGHIVLGQLSFLDLLLQPMQELAMRHCVFDLKA